MLTRIASTRHLRNNSGMTLVEVMVAMLIVAIISDIVYNVSLSQMRSVNESGSVLEAAGSPTTALELFKRDLALAGYGALDMLDVAHQKNIALYIQDGGNIASDKLFLFDGSYIDLKELSYDFYGELGHASITAGAGSPAITLDKLDLDAMTAKYDDEYGTAPPYDPNEFAGGIWQYVISNTTDPTQKVARITNIAGNTLNLDANVAGTMVGPAVYYCVDKDGNDNSCHPAGSLTSVLRRSSRESGGRQPVAENIVDMQIAYKVGTTWYCDGTGSCPVNPIYAGDIKLIRISIIAQIGVTTNQVLVAAENGPQFGNTLVPNSTTEYYSYQVFTTSIRPRNNIEFK